MTKNSEEDFNDSNSIMIRLNQIEEGGKVKITHYDITLLYEYCDNQSSFAEETTKYKRLITFDELTSLYSAIELLNTNTNSNSEKDSQSKDNNQSNNKKEDNIYTRYKNSYLQSKKIQGEIQQLHNYGKTFVLEDYPFFELSSNNCHIFESIENQKKQYDSIKKTKIPFITQNNLLYFGSLLQRKEIDKVHQIIIKMLPITKNDKYKKYIKIAIKENINDPMKCATQMFSLIYGDVGNKIKYEKPTEPLDHQLLDNKFIDMQKDLLLYFFSQNLLVVKVKKPSETFHVLRIIKSLLYNCLLRHQYFYEDFYCYEDSDLKSYLDDFENPEVKIQTLYSFIIHPELLSSLNKNILKEKITSRLQLIPDATLQKYVIITSSYDFIFGNHAKDLNGKLYAFGDMSMNVDANVLRKYFPKNAQMYFNIQIRQSMNAGYGKTTSINKEIEEIKTNTKYKFQVFHHFVTDGNQPIPIDSFNPPSNTNILSINHFQFSDEIMKQGIKFWSYLYQLYSNGFVLPRSGEPLLINFLEKNVVFFELPQLNGEYQPLHNLSEFPLPVSSEIINGQVSFLSEKYQEPIRIDKTFIKNQEFENTSINTYYYMYGINSVVDELKDKPTQKIDNLEKYIEMMYKIIFRREDGPKENTKKGKNKKKNVEIDEEIDLVISFRKLGYIEKYLHKYTKLYINSLFNSENEIDQKQFVKFFYILTVSAFYAYNCLPIKEQGKQKYRSKFGLTFVTVENLFNDQVESCEKKVNFFTTKTQKELLKHLNKPDYSKPKYFNIHFEYDGTKPDPRSALENIFCSSKEYKSIVEEFENKNPKSYISRTQMTLPTLFRSSILLSRIFLTHPIILEGDTGCGKTSSLMILYEYFKLPFNKEMHMLNIEVGKTLNCHGGITTKDVTNHLKEASKSSKKHIIFFDELNTSPASSYIEYLLLNESKKYH